MANCIYIDEDGKWWLAHIDDNFEEIVLIKESTGDYKKRIIEQGIQSIGNLYVLFWDVEGEANWLPAKDMKIRHHQN